MRTVINLAVTQLTVAHTIGGSSFTGTPADGPNFVSGTQGPPSSGKPIQITVVKAANLNDFTRANRTRWLCTSFNSSTCVFSGLTLVEGTDQDFAIGDFVLIEVDSQVVEELQTAVGTNSTDIATLQSTAELTAHKAQANGYASLDSGGKVPTGQIPAIAESGVTGLVSDLAACEKIANKAQANGYASLDSGGKVPTGQIPAIAESGVTGLVSDLAATEKTANKAQANGYAGLDSGGKVPTAQLPASVLGAVDYQGTWNAATNSPALASGVGTKGFYYLVSTAGSTAIDGHSSWSVGDWIVFDGNVWEQVDNHQAVTSVAGKTGVVTLVEGDVANLTADLAARELLAHKNAANGYAGLDSNGELPQSRIEAIGLSGVTLSSLGVVGGANLAQGSTNYGAGDESSTWQSVLNGGNVRLIVDLPVCGIFKVKSNTEIFVPHKGCGCILPQNANTTMIQNLNWVNAGAGEPVTQFTGAPTTAGGWVDDQIKILGGTWNCNGTNQNNLAHDYPAGSPSNLGGNFIRFAGVGNFEVEGATVHSVAGFGIWFWNFNRAIIRRNNISNAGGGYTLGTDNIHPNGPGNVAWIEGNVLKSGDNSVAANTDDATVDGGLSSAGFPIAPPGNIGTLYILNNYWDATGLDCIEIQSAKSRIETVIIRGSRGSAAQGLLTLRYPHYSTWLSGFGNLGSLSLDDTDITLTSTPYDVGAISLAVASGRIRIDKIRRRNFSQPNVPLVFLDYDGGNLDSLSIDGVEILDSSDSAEVLRLYGFAKKIRVANCQIENGNQTPALITVPYNATGNGTVVTGCDQLLLEGIEANGVDYILDVQSQRKLPCVNALGIIHTGSTKSGSINNDGVIGTLVASNVNGPGTAAGNPVVGSQFPAVAAGDAFVAPVTAQYLKFLDLAADANTYADSSFSTPQSTNGGAVLGLKDLIGASPGLYNATTSSSHNPTLLTNAQNSLNGLAFDGSTSRLTLARRLEWPAFTILCAFIPRNVSTEGVILSDFNIDISSNQYGWLLEQNHTGGKATFYTATGSGAGTHHDFGTLTNNTPTIVAIAFDGTDVTAYQGSSGTLTSALSATPATISYANSVACVPLVGALAAGAGFGNFGQFTFLEALAFPGTDATARNAFYNTLKTKWNISN